MKTFNPRYARRPPPSPWPPRRASPRPSTSAKPINKQRINQGVRSGELTPGEAAHDERHLTSIEDQTARERARNGGRLTAQQRVHEQRRLNHDSRRIYRTKHNGRVG